MYAFVYTLKFFGENSSFAYENIFNYFPMTCLLHQSINQLEEDFNLHNINFTVSFFILSC